MGEDSRGPLEGEVGASWPLVSFSDIYFKSLHDALREAEGCGSLDFNACAQLKGMSRVAFVTAMGRGLGATVAHELGHQGGVAFTVHVPTSPEAKLRCPGCYDADSAAFHEHFFGPLVWSKDSKDRMKRLLLPR